MKKTFFNIFVFFAVQIFAQTEISVTNYRPGSFERSKVLDPKGRIELGWKISGDSIDFEVVAQTKGWVGIGFSPNGGMNGADILVGWIDENNKAHISDRHGTSNGFPPKDSHNDYDLTGAMKNGTHIVLAFRRKINICNSEDFDISGGTTKVIWALNDELPKSEENFSKHSYRGVKSLYLLDPSVEKQPLPPNTKKIEVKLSNVAIPSDKDTLYYCEVFKLPISTKHHMIRSEPIIQANHEAFVHHMILYGCPIDMERFVGKGMPCFENLTTMETPMNLCSSRSIAGWAIGGEGGSYPPDFGFPLLESYETPYVMLEMHYDNSLFKTGIRDNSGMRLFVTDQLRKIELDEILIGIPVGPTYQIIPPNVQNFSNYGFCTPECTKHFPSEGINVISVMAHAHMTGKQMFLRHFRDGKQLPDILADYNYDFNYQETHSLSKPIKILPGDTLVAECVYDTTSRTKTTLSGLSTHEEMCEFYLDFYPRGNTAINCVSALKLDQYPEDPDVKEITAEGSVIMKNGKKVEFTEYLREIDWEVNDPKKFQKLMNEFQMLLRDGTHEVECDWRSFNDSEIEFYTRKSYPDDPDAIKQAKASKLTLEKFDQHGYPKVKEWRNPENKCARFPRSNRNEEETKGEEGSESNSNSNSNSNSGSGISKMNSFLFVLLLIIYY